MQLCSFLLSLVFPPRAFNSFRSPTVLVESEFEAEWEKRENREFSMKIPLKGNFRLKQDWIYECLLVFISSRLGTVSRDCPFIRVSVLWSYIFSRTQYMSYIRSAVTFAFPRLQSPLLAEKGNLENINLSYFE